MNKKDVKAILIRMETKENVEAVKYILGKIDLKEEKEIQQILKQIGDSEQAIKEFWQKTIDEIMKTINARQAANNLLGRIIEGAEIEASQEEIGNTAQLMRRRT